MSNTVAQTVTDNDYMNHQFCDDYEPIDLTRIYFPTIIPPPELVEAWEQYRAAYASIYGITEQKIGNTWYTILTDCDGNEKLIDKIKRLIFSEPLPRMEAIPR